MHKRILGQMDEDTVTQSKQRGLERAGRRPAEETEGPEGNDRLFRSFQQEYSDKHTQNGRESEDSRKRRVHGNTKLAGIFVFLRASRSARMLNGNPLRMGRLPRPKTVMMAGLNDAEPDHEQQTKARKQAHSFRVSRVRGRWMDTGSHVVWPEIGTISGCHGIFLFANTAARHLLLCGWNNSGAPFIARALGAMGGPAQNFTKNPESFHVNPPFRVVWNCHVVAIIAVIRTREK